MALWFYYSTSMKDVAANIPWVSHFGIWYGLSIQIWKLMMLDTILIPTWSGISIQVQKKTLKLLHLHHFRDFAGLFFSPVWWPPAFFFGSFDERCFACKASSTWRMRKAMLVFTLVGSHGEIPKRIPELGPKQGWLFGEEDSMLVVLSYIGSTGKDVAAFSKVSWWKFTAQLYQVKILLCWDPKISDLIAIHHWLYPVTLSVSGSSKNSFAK